MRFLLAGVCSVNICTLEPYMRKPLDLAIAKARTEDERWHDIEFLDMHENVLGGCALKYFKWIKIALVRYSTSFIAFADDDVYIS